MGKALRLRPGVHAAPVTAGLLITGRGGSRLVRGDARALDALWMEHLPALDAGVEAADVPGELLESLVDAGLLVPADAVFGNATVEYLAAFVAEPAAGYEAFRRLDVRLSGSGAAAFCAGRALLNFGLPRLGVVGVDEATRLQLSDVAGRCGAVVSDRGDVVGADVLITVDADRPVPDGVPWLGIALCGASVVVGPLRMRGGGLGLDDALAMMRCSGGQGRETAPVAAALAGNLAALDVLALGTGMSTDHRWRAHVVHAEGVRAEQVPVVRRDVGPLASSAGGTATDSPLGAPVPVADHSGPGELFQCALPDGRKALGFDADGHAARLAAARLLIPMDAAEVWPGRPAVLSAGFAAAVVGTSEAGFLRDGVRRVLCASAQAGGAERDRYLTSIEADPVSDPFFERMHIPLTVELFGFGDVLTVAAVTTYGRPLGIDCAPDADTALAGALRQAAAVVIRGADVVPTHADEMWDPQPALAAFAAVGTPMATARWVGEPAPTVNAMLGWVGLEAGR